MSELGVGLLLALFTALLSALGFLFWSNHLLKGKLKTANDKETIANNVEESEDGIITKIQTIKDSIDVQMKDVHTKIEHQVKEVKDSIDKQKDNIFNELKSMNEKLVELTTFNAKQEEKNSTMLEKFGRFEQMLNEVWREIQIIEDRQSDTEKELSELKGEHNKNLSIPRTVTKRR